MSARGGIDLGGTKIQAVVVDGRNRVIGEARRPTPASGGGEAVVVELAGAMEDALASTSGRRPALSGIGVGSPGEIDAGRGTVAQARNVAGMDEAFPIGGELGRMLGGVPVALGNDVSVATQAEFELGAGKPYDSLLGVFWGTGVGGGIVLDGKMWDGRGAAGEIGHTVIVEGGRRCPCGRRGCLEAYAGRAAMEARARKKHANGTKTNLFEIMERKGRDRLTSGIWSRALDSGDRLATKLIDRAIEALGTGIASAVNLLDVEAVVLGGGLGVRLGPRYLDRLQAEMEPHLFKAERPPATQVAALGDLGGAVGAALLAPRPAGRSRGRTSARRTTRSKPQRRAHAAAKR